jgi:hypothetical protein
VPGEVSEESATMLANGTKTPSGPLMGSFPTQGSKTTVKALSNTAREGVDSGMALGSSDIHSESSTHHPKRGKKIEENGG